MIDDGSILKKLSELLARDSGQVHLGVKKCCACEREPILVLELLSCCAERARVVAGSLARVPDNKTKLVVAVGWVLLAGQSMLCSLRTCTLAPAHPTSGLFSSPESLIGSSSRIRLPSRRRLASSPTSISSRATSPPPPLRLLTIFLPVPACTFIIRARRGLLPLHAIASVLGRPPESGIWPLQGESADAWCGSPRPPPPQPPLSASSEVTGTRGPSTATRRPRPRIPRSQQTAPPPHMIL